MAPDRLVQMRTALIVKELLATHGVVAAAGTSWKWQLRDHNGKWIEMGAKVKWLANGKKFTGKVIGSPEEGIALVQNDDGGEPTRLTANRLSIDDKAAPSVPDVPNAPNVPSPKVTGKSTADRMKRAILTKETAASKSKTPNVLPKDKHGNGPGHPYYGYERTSDGRVILNPADYADLSEETGPHTMSKHLEDTTDADGNKVKVLSKEREALHVELIRRATEGVKPNPNGKVAFFTGGGSGAGKGTATKKVEGYPKVRELKEHGKETPGEAVLIDADAFKEEMPEWGEPDMDTTAGFTHEESSFLAKKTQDVAVRQDQDFVLDGTGDGNAKSMKGKIAKAKNAGYATKAVYVTVPTDEALIRTITRAMGNGRFLDAKLVTGIHASVSRLFPEISPDYDDHSLWDSNVPPGSPPNLISANGRIVDQQKYDEFLAKSGDTVESVVDQAIEFASTRGFQAIDQAWDGKKYSEDDVREFVLKFLQKTKEGLAAK